MPHILCRLKNVDIKVVEETLKSHKEIHAKDGMHLEHLWQNADDPQEAIFLFRVDDLAHARAVMKRNHAAARKVDPHANLPTITFLE